MVNSDTALADLEHLRTRIDDLDSKLVTILAERLEVCSEVAVLKARDDIPMMQPGRVDAVVRRCREMGAPRGLRPEFLDSLYRTIIAETCTLEDDIIARLKAGRMSASST